MRTATWLATSALAAALALQFLAPMGPTTPGTALPERSLSRIRGASDTGMVDEDYCAYFDIDLSQVTWLDCYGQPDGTTQCIKCENGKFNVGIPDQSEGGWKGDDMFCFTRIRKVGLCYGGTCQDQEEAGKCKQTVTQFVVQ